METPAQPAVQLETETVLVPKEMNDVRKFLVQLVKDIKAKKPAMEIAGSSLPGLIAAVDGMDKLDEEVKSPHAIDCGALLSADVTKILLGK